MSDITPKELRSLRERITFEISRDSGPIRRELEDALRNAADQLERQAWIPCSERMPPAGYWLVRDVSLPRVRILFRRVTSHESYWVAEDAHPFHGVVTYWGPLPPLPPEGES